MSGTGQVEPGQVASTRWFIAAPWLRTDADTWRLTRFVPNQNKALEFRVVGAHYTLDRSRKYTGVGAWGEFLRHGSRTWQTAQRSEGKRGIITAFPQLPIPVGLRKRLARADIPVVAWTFNLGKLPAGLRRRLSRVALKAVDRFVVHSRGEIATYSSWLDLPPERFEFIPFETPVRDIEFAEEHAEPFIVSLGSAHRDYRLLFSVLAELPYRAVVVAAPHAVAGLSAPANVTVRSGLTAQQCFELMQRARLNVIPIANQTTASGQVTLLDGMMLGRPIVVTACASSLDYVTHGHDAWTVRPGDHDDLKAGLRRLWEDDVLRGHLGREARRTALAVFAEPVVGRELERILFETGAGR